MYYILAIWLYGVTIAVLPVTFPTHASCERAGEAFLKKAHNTKAKAPGYACVPIDFTDEQVEDKP